MKTGLKNVHLGNTRINVVGGWGLLFGVESKLENYEKIQ